MKNALMYLFAITVLFFVISCEKEDVSTRQESLVNKQELVKQFSETLADALKYPEVRAFIKGRVLKKFDGDYNFLIAKDRNEKLKINGRNDIVKFEDLFKLNNNEGLSKDVQNLLDELQSTYPLLQVAIPQLEDELVESWNEETFIPLVAFVPSEIENSSLPIVDTDGNWSTISSEIAPEELTIVVSQNERLVCTLGPIDGSEKHCHPISALYELDNYYYYEDAVFMNWDDCNFNSSGTSTHNDPPTDPKGGFPCAESDRAGNGAKDNLHRMKIKNMYEFRRLNEWFDGGQEFQVTIIFATSNNTVGKVTKIFGGRDRDFVNRSLFDENVTVWFDINEEIITWQPELQGSNMLYIWIEKDTGNETEYTTSYTTEVENEDDDTTRTLEAGVSLTITDEDDLLGEAIVEYCDDTTGDGYTYSTGKVLFQVNQQ